MADRIESRDSCAVLDAIRNHASTGMREKIDLTLAAMTRLLEALENPQNKLPPVVHIAGTNGKGSTLAFLRAILAAANLRVHTYTSPYLTTLHESICLAGPEGTAPIPEAQLAACLERVHQAQCSEVPATAFEAETAAAFLAFAETPADIVLLETGLGGRLDATNVVDTPTLTIISPIAIDHAEFLGNSLGDIAREKAGILKPNVPVIIGRQDDDAYGTLERYATHLQAPVSAAGRDWDAFEQHGRLVFQDEQHLRDLRLPALHGRHQIDNAALAIAAALMLDARSPAIEVSDEALEAGLANVRWPGRLERIPPDYCNANLPTGSEIWIDGGHNAAAASVLASAMADLEEATPLPLYMIVGMLASKDPESFLRPFKGLVRSIAAIRLPEQAHATAHPMDPAIIVGAGEANMMDAHAMSSLDGALDWIVRQDDGPVRILICGSLHLANDVSLRRAKT